MITNNQHKMNKKVSEAIYRCHTIDSIRSYFYSPSIVFGFLVGAVCLAACACVCVCLCFPIPPDFRLFY